jgi:acyl carrier protein
MSELAQRIAALSPEKRDLLLRRVQQDQQRTDLPAPASEAAPATDRSLPFPLADIQQVYWLGQSGFFDLGGCGASAYFELQLSGVDETFPKRLNRAVERLIRRHDMLRSIVLADGRQRVLAAPPTYQVEVIDLQGHEAAAVETRLTAVRERMRYGKKDLELWPLFDFMVHLLDGRSLRLHLRFESLILDGGSRNILFRELFALLEKPDLELPPVGYSYQEYVLATSGSRRENLTRSARDYWSHFLADLPPAPDLPLAGYPEPARGVQLRNRFAQALSPTEWARFQARASHERLTPSAAVLAAFVETLSTWSANPRFTLSLAGTHRPEIHPHIHEVVGNFNTILLLKVEPIVGDFGTRARQLQEQARSSLDYRHFSGVQVLREFNRRRVRSSRASMPVIFNSLIEYNRGNRTEEGPGARFQTAYVDAGLYAPQILLMVTVDEIADALHCRFQTVEELFPEGRVVELLNTFTGRLRRLATDEASWTEPWIQVRDGDSLVRVLGYPVELHRVEACLESQPGVRMAAVVAVPRPPDHRLAAYLVGEPAREPELRARLAAALPYYMVPDHLLWIDELPLRPDGTVDRQVLAARPLPPRRPRLADEISEELARELTGIWEEVLGRHPIGSQDDFFDLGGDSFLLVVMMNRLEDRFGKGPALVEFFREPTVEFLAELLRTSKIGSDAPPRNALGSTEYDTGSLFRKEQKGAVS